MPRPVVATSLVLAAACSVGASIAACGGGGGGGPAFGLASRVPVTTLTFPTTTPTVGSVAFRDAFPNLSFSSPVFVGAPPGDTGRLFVVEQGGFIRVFPNAATTLSSQVKTFLDIDALVTSGGELGLLGLAFDPAYATNRRFYVNYTTGSLAGGTLRSVVARYTASVADPDVADTTATILFEVPKPFDTHCGGMLAFGPDGFLYSSFGDGGSAGDPQGNAQRLTTLLGKVVRIDVNGTSEGAYGVPSDNPFAGATDGRRHEIYAWGFRNPFRFSFDRGTGRLWLGDVGQSAREEIDVVRLGGNYGWRAMEGNLVFDADDLHFGPFDAPVLDYGRTLGNVVTGGYVYRGTAVSFLVGFYVYADFGSGRVWALGYDGTRVTSNVEIANEGGISSFGEDAAGELYACNLFTGRILAVEPASPVPTEFPQTLTATGLFSDVPSMTPTPGLVPYAVQMDLWSDDAIKDRFIALPWTTTVDWSEDGAWAFPTDTVLVKTFRLPLTAGDPSSAVRVETRVLLHSSNGWEGYSYRWRDDQTDADLLPDGATRTLTIADAAAPGGTRSQTWQFPSRTDCLRCHTVAAGRILGLTTRQLNGSFDYAPFGGIADNQLRTWAHIDMFSSGIPDPDALPSHPRLGDATAAVALRARAYLDTNCSMCHRPGGPTGVAIDLRSTVSVAAMQVLNVAPQSGNLGLPAPFIVDGGDRNNSVLWLRMRALDATRMPPLATSLVHQAGSDVVGQWIDDGP
jgi:uncharacterized repeat protein (TIGR03806 family)